MCIHNPLSVKHFHGVSAGNTHECSLKSRIGEVSGVLPRRDRPGALLLYLPRRDVRLTLGPARGARTRGACRGTSEGKGQSWRGMFREDEVSAHFLTLRAAGGGKGRVICLYSQGVLGRVACTLAAIAPWHPYCALTGCEFC